MTKLEASSSISSRLFASPLRPVSDSFFFFSQNTFLADRALQTEVRQNVRQRHYASPRGSRIVVPDLNINYNVYDESPRRQRKGK